MGETAFLDAFENFGRVLLTLARAFMAESGMTGANGVAQAHGSR